MTVHIMVVSEPLCHFGLKHITHEYRINVKNKKQNLSGFKNNKVFYYISSRYCLKVIMNYNKKIIKL